MTKMKNSLQQIIWFKFHTISVNFFILLYFNLMYLRQGQNNIKITFYLFENWKRRMLKSAFNVDFIYCLYMDIFLNNILKSAHIWLA